MKKLSEKEILNKLYNFYLEYGVNPDNEQPLNIDEYKRELFKEDLLFLENNKTLKNDLLSNY